MNFLTIEGLSKTYDTKILFENISLSINKGQKVALVARNGAGKTSLMRIIMGAEVADAGTISIRKGITTAFLEQEPHLDEAKSILENVFIGNSPIIHAISNYEKCLIEQEHTHTEESMKRLEKAHEVMTVLDAWDYELKIKQILSHLNIHDLEQPVKTLSGGQKKRVALSKVLILEPDFLILDEPTNHLDIDMIEWLEEFLSTKNMTLLIVTHDRYFLDRICTQIIELDKTTLFPYNGNYSLYVEKKATREMVEASEFEKTKNIYRKELEWVRKMPKARTTKSKSRLDSFDVIEEKVKGKVIEEKLKLEVKMTRIGGKILEMHKVSKSFGAISILKKFTYDFKRGEKIGIIGKNGVGKTTFLNMLMGLEKPDSGKIQSGETIVFGYYSQSGLRLKEDKRVLDIVKDIAEFIPMADGSKLSASQLLLRFQFAPETQYAFVSKLSGGEKRRLYLMTLLITNPNFLILDEPTNDLDILTLSILEEFLKNYQGCVIIVSHDRFFMDKLVDSLFIFEGDGIVKSFPGNYSEYRISVKSENKEKVNPASTDIATNSNNTNRKEAQTDTSKKRKISFKERLEFETLEKEIAQLETDKKEIEDKLSSGIFDHKEIATLSQRMLDVTNLLDEKSFRWLELSEIVS
ncbi:MAG: ABC-F family ATP-binding cassette domain-containing protein [Chitinophagales bacterium]